MARKKLKKKVQAKSAASRNTNPVVDSAREIWLAGLGAFSVAQAEGSKILDGGNKMFETLVAEGSRLEKKTRKDVEGAVDDLRSDIESRVGDIRSDIESRINEIRGNVESRFGGVREQAESVRKQAESVRKQATANWDKLENIFEERVSRSLGKLGIPTSDDVNELAQRVQKLSRQVEALAKGGKPARSKAAVKKAAVKKTVLKKTVVKKTVLKKAAVKKAAVKKATVKKAAVKKAAPEAPKAPKAA